MTPPAIKKMTELATALLNELAPAQLSKVGAPFAAPSRRQIEYRPLDRAGLSLGDMTSAQQDLTMRLVEAACGEYGFQLVTQIIELESVLKEWDEMRSRASAKVRSPLRYWLAIYGTPEVGGIWGYSFSGHHVVVNVTIVGAELAIAPLFLGANPAEIKHGARKGERVITKETELPRALLASLDAGQRNTAVASATAPYDIISQRHETFSGVPDNGIRLGALSTNQAELLLDIVKLYLSRSEKSAADAQWAALSRADISDCRFTWLGSLAPAEPHYYSITVGKLVIEYDCTQDNANHIHTVVRDLARDWGRDALGDHYAAHHPK